MTNPQITSFLGVLFLIIGAGAVYIMLELKGRPKDRPYNRLLILTHRVLGYVFVLIFLIMLGLMISKISSYQGEFAPRAIVHIVLSVTLIPLLIIKILIARRYKLLTPYLLGFGVAVFITSFALNALSAGYYFLYRSDVRYVAISEHDTVVLDETMGRRLVNEKCGKCHTLERVFRSFKSEEGWTTTTNRMALIDAPNIRDFDAKQIIHYLVAQQETREKLSEVAAVEEEIGKTLVDQNCSLCHDLERVFKSSKTREEWIGTVDTMADYMGDPEFVSQDEKESIAEFLANQPEE